MREHGWAVGLILAFGLGLAAGGWLGRGPLATPEIERLREAQQRLQSEVSALRARPGGDQGEDGQAGPGSGEARARAAAAPRVVDGSVTSGTLQAYARHVLLQREELRAAAGQASAAAAAAATSQAALDRFYLYLEEMNGPGGLERWQRMQQLTDELRRMGPVGVDALMRVLGGGSATADERRIAAQLLGELEAAAALPLLEEILDNDGDFALRRAAVSSLRRIESPGTIPILEALLLNSSEDRFIRMNAASGLAQMDRSQGVGALMQMFEDSSLDARGRDLAFSALSALSDARALPFMRQLVASNAETTHRVRAVRFLSAQTDRQALPLLHQIAQSPTEPASLKTAAAQAAATIKAR